MAVEPERACQLVAEIAARTLAGDPPDHLADQPSEGDCVIAVLRSRLPEGLFASEQAGHIIPIVIGLGFEPLAHCWQSGAVVKELAYADSAFAFLREFGPIARDWRIKFEPAFSGQTMGADGDKAFGGRENVGEGVVRPRPGARFVGIATPQI